MYYKVIKLKCPNCGSSSESIRSHFRSHSAEIAYHCSSCGRLKLATNDKYKEEVNKFWRDEELLNERFEYNVNKG